MLIEFLQYFINSPWKNVVLFNTIKLLLIITVIMTKTLITFFWNEKKIIWNKNKQTKKRKAVLLHMYRSKIPKLHWYAKWIKNRGLNQTLGSRVMKNILQQKQLSQKNRWTLTLGEKLNFTKNLWRLRILSVHMWCKLTLLRSRIGRLQRYGSGKLIFQRLYLLWDKILHVLV